MKTQTKAELEDEITRLRQRIAELEGEVSGLKYALLNKPQEPVTYPDYRWTWPQATWTNPEPIKITC